MTNKEAIYLSVAMMRGLNQAGFYKVKSSFFSYKNYLDESIASSRSELIKIINTQHNYQANIDAATVFESSQPDVLASLQGEARKIKTMIDEYRRAIQGMHDEYLEPESITPQLSAIASQGNDSAVSDYVSLLKDYGDLSGSIKDTISTALTAKQQDEALNSIKEKLQKLALLKAREIKQKLDTRELVGQKLAIIDMSLHVIDVVISGGTSVDVFLTQPNRQIEEWFYAKNIAIDSFLRPYSFNQ